MGAERNTEPDESLSEHSSGNIEGLIANQSLLEDYLSREHLTAQIADLTGAGGLIQSISMTLRVRMVWGARSSG